MQVTTDWPYGVYDFNPPTNSHRHYGVSFRKSKRMELRKLAKTCDAIQFYLTP